MLVNSEKTEAWFASRGFTPFEHQLASWEAFENQQNILLHAPTGTGKTYAALFAPPITDDSSLSIIWVTPLRALAADLERAIAEPLRVIAPHYSVLRRTGDVKASIKAKIRKKLPSVLITTPESLSLLCTYPEVASQFENLKLIVVDEWHQLIGSKRGVQTELLLSYLRGKSPKALTFGLSATIGNLDQALEVLTYGEDRESRIIRSSAKKRIEITSVIPQKTERFPWYGHIGLSLFEQVKEHIDCYGTSLLFTNTRNQAELWYQALKDTGCEESFAIHHGSIDSEERSKVENGLREGIYKCVVCTSSLDLGVDFPPVEQIIQVGSPKGVGRLLQRAGRSGHQPGAKSRVVCVPTNSFELLEFAAARKAVEALDVESRAPYTLSLDVLAQHAVSLALGEGFEAKHLFEQVKKTNAFASLTSEQWAWVLSFIQHGGESLQAYDQFKKVEQLEGVYRVTSKTIAKWHRMSIGTISSNSMVQVRFAKGASLGFVEESFIAKLRPRQKFVFAGRTLELVQFRNMKALVRLAKGKTAAVPKWVGGRLPLSTHLAERVHAQLSTDEATAERTGLSHILSAQAKLSHLPRVNELLIETISMRDGYRVFIYPFKGRAVHESLGILFAHRLSLVDQLSITVAANDYGLELLSNEKFEFDLVSLLDSALVVEHILAALTATELARRNFRDIARVAGLVLQGYPGQRKNARQLQASSGLIFDVLSRYDPKNLLLEQAEQEVLEQQLQVKSLESAMADCRSMHLIIRDIAQLSPLAFPLWAERISSQHSSEKLSVTIQKMISRLEKQVGP